MPPGSPEALYLHVPFCRSRCRYCAFLSGEFSPDLASRYLEAAIREAGLLPLSDRDLSGVTTVYIGGGTPTVLPHPLFERLLEVVARLAGGSSPVEFTVEANPESLDAHRLRLLAESGATRVSLGVQSDDDRLLRFLGRPHDARAAERAAALVNDAGLALSVDLIYGLPGQGRRSWGRTLRWAAGLGAGHLSAYALTVEEGTLLGASVAAGEATPPAESDLLALHRTAREILSMAGFVHYEISNFALPGRECRHNLAYWRYRPYLGLGAGAHSRLRDGDAVIARENPATAGYLAALEGDPPRDPGARMRLAPGEVLEEILLMGLRIGGGIAPSDQPAFAGRLRALRCSGFWGALIDRGLALDLEALALTADGWWLADGIAGEAARALESG